MVDRPGLGHDVGGAIEPTLEDRGQAAIAQGPEAKGALRGGLEPLGAVDLAQPHDPERRAEALLGMGPGGDDAFDEPACRRARLGRPPDDALRRPLERGLVGLGHVLANRGVPPRLRGTGVARHTAALVEALDHPGRDPGLKLDADQLIGNAVVMAADLDVIIERDADPTPLGQLVALGGKGKEGRTVERLVLGTPGAWKLAEAPGVEVLEKLADRGVELPEREEGPVPQPGQNPALGHLDGALDLGLVPRPADPGRQSRRAVMGQTLGVGRVDPGLVAAGPADPGPEVVRDDQRRDAAEVFEGPDMGADPVGRRLRPGRFGVGVARGPENGHEDLGLAGLSGLPVDDADGAAGIIDEHPLARLVVQPHPDRAASGPFAVKITVPAVLVAQGMGLLVLVPEQEQRHALAPEFVGDLRPVRKWAVHRRDERCWREQPPLQDEVVAIGRQRPAEPGLLGPPDILGDCRAGQAQARRHLPRRQSQPPAQPQGFSYLPHR